MTEKKPRGFCRHQVATLIAAHTIETGGRPEFGITAPDAPGPGSFTGQPPEMFLGRHVKLAFPTGLQRPSHERMWVRVKGLFAGDTGEQLEGTLDNDPRFTRDWHHGMTLAFNVSEIIEILSDAEA
jgi:hypothetical protein